MREQYRIRLVESMDLPRGTISDIFDEKVTLGDVFNVISDNKEFFGQPKSHKAFGDLLPTGAHRYYRYAWEKTGTLGFRFHAMLLIERLTVNATV